MIQLENADKRSGTQTFPQATPGQKELAFSLLQEAKGCGDRGQLHSSKQSLKPLLMSLSWLSKLGRKTITPSPSKLGIITALQLHDWPNSSLLPSSLTSLRHQLHKGGETSSEGCPPVGWQTTKYTSIKVLNSWECGCLCNPEYLVHYPTDT